MSSSSLFSEFPPVSSKQWKQKIQYDLKGTDYNETLVWESLEGIKVKPFYHREDTEYGFQYPLPKNHKWNIGQTIFVANTEKANTKALSILKCGIQTLIFTIPKPRIKWPQLLQGIDLATTPILFNLQFLEVECIKNLLDATANSNVDFSFQIDILGHLARTGNWFHSLSEDYKKLQEIVQLTNRFSTVSTLAVDMGLYQNAGATMVQQLAYGLTHANEYLNYFDTHSKEAKEKPITFKVAVGTNYFFEIAKIKALRWLWNTIKTPYGLTQDCHLVAIPSKRNKTIYDYNVNMLRTTAESMASVLGGANTILNLPYDAIYHKENEFGERIARNQLLLLKEESFFDEALKASEGVYYIETLTHQLAQKALELFKQIEASGGFLKELKKGSIHKKIKASAKKEQELFNERKLVLLGTNTYQNSNDKMNNSLEIYPFLKQKKRKTLIQPIIEKRLAENLEQERLKKE